MQPLIWFATVVLALAGTVQEAKAPADGRDGVRAGVKMAECAMDGASLRAAVPLDSSDEGQGGDNGEGEEVAEECCKICSKGKACGDSCISQNKECHKAPGCACDG